MASALAVTNDVDYGSASSGSASSGGEDEVDNRLLPIVNGSLGERRGSMNWSDIMDEEDEDNDDNYDDNPLLANNEEEHDGPERNSNSGSGLWSDLCEDEDDNDDFDGVQVVQDPSHQHQPQQHQQQQQGQSNGHGGSRRGTRGGAKSRSGRSTPQPSPRAGGHNALQRSRGDRHSSSRDYNNTPQSPFRRNKSWDDVREDDGVMSGGGSSGSGEDEDSGFNVVSHKRSRNSHHNNDNINVNDATFSPRQRGEYSDSYREGDRDRERGRRGGSSRHNNAAGADESEHHLHRSSSSERGGGADRELEGHQGGSGGNHGTSNGNGNSNSNNGRSKYRRHSFALTGSGNAPPPRSLSRSAVGSNSPRMGQAFPRGELLSPLSPSQQRTSLNEQAHKRTASGGSGRSRPRLSHSQEASNQTQQRRGGSNTNNNNNNNNNNNHNNSHNNSNNKGDRTPDSRKPNYLASPRSGGNYRREGTPQKAHSLPRGSTSPNPWAGGGTPVSTSQSWAQVTRPFSPPLPSSLSVSSLPSPSPSINLEHSSQEQQHAEETGVASAAHPVLAVETPQAQAPQIATSVVEQHEQQQQQQQQPKDEQVDVAQPQTQSTAAESTPTTAVTPVVATLNISRGAVPAIRNQAQPNQAATTNKNNKGRGPSPRGKQQGQRTPRSNSCSPRLEITPPPAVEKTPAPQPQVVVGATAAVPVVSITKAVDDEPQKQVTDAPKVTDIPAPVAPKSNNAESTAKHDKANNTTAAAEVPVKKHTETAPVGKQQPVSETKTPVIAPEKVSVPPAKAALQTPEKTVQQLQPSDNDDDDVDNDDDDSASEEEEDEPQPAKKQTNIVRRANKGGAISSPATSNRRVNVNKRAARKRARQQQKAQNNSTTAADLRAYWYILFMMFMVGFGLCLAVVGYFHVLES
eukprot:TRINITY_DN2839_c1_g2_i3.p1 TRINITY_DN2839_c1_g2~~TRINITY_DN2839_c1_g2_i3.p1  ORF type:complete len:913 (+),score=230.12 TRINITY_DN2839_c1_g2_i3:283-3021(+)